jgi:hypothetical protein
MCIILSAVRVVGRMALVALVIGTAVTVSATERVTLSLVLAGGIGWSFVPVLQALTGILLVRNPGPGASVPSLATALDRYFATGWPWSLWILGVHGAFLMIPATRSFGWLLGLTAVAPMVWTVRRLLVLCRNDLGMGRAKAWRRVALHQAVTCLLILAYIAFAVALWPRIVGVLA